MATGTDADLPITDVNPDDAAREPLGRSSRRQHTEGRQTRVFGNDVSSSNRHDGVYAKP